MEVFSAIILLILLVVGYFIPWIVAKYRDHPQEGSIFLLNLFLGWTFLGWVIAAVWSASTFTASKVVKKEGETISCPDCAEKINKAAKKCRFCGLMLTNEEHI